MLVISVQIRAWNLNPYSGITGTIYIRMALKPVYFRWIRTGSKSYWKIINRIADKLPKLMSIEKYGKISVMQFDVMIHFQVKLRNRLLSAGLEPVRSLDEN